MNNKSRKAILALCLAILLSSIWPGVSGTFGLTPSKYAGPIRIESITIGPFADDNSSEAFINASLGYLEPGQKIRISWQAIGDFSEFDHFAGFWGIKDRPDVVESKNLLFADCKENYFDWIVPNFSNGPYLKIWIWAKGKFQKITNPLNNDLAKDLGGANSRPVCLRKDLFAPNVTTTDAMDITSDGAKLRGNMWWPGNAPPSYVWFQIRPENGSFDSNQALGYRELDERAMFEFDYYGKLLPNTLYYFRAIGANFAGTCFGREMEFRTKSKVPLVRTLPATDVKLKEFVSDWRENQATLNLQIDDFGGADAQTRFQWYDKNEKNPEMHYTDWVWIKKSEKPALWKEHLYLPDGGSTYLFRACVKNDDNEEDNGQWLYFPPPYPAPELEIFDLHASKLKQWHSATISVEVKSIGIGGPVEIWIEYWDADRANNPVGDMKQIIPVKIDNPGIYEIVVDNLPSNRGFKGYDFMGGNPNLELREAEFYNRFVPGWVYRVRARNPYGQEDIDQGTYCKKHSAYHYKCFGTRFNPEPPIARALKADNIAHTTAELRLGLIWTGFDEKLEYWAKLVGNGKTISTMHVVKKIPLEDYATMWVNGYETLTLPIEGLDPGTYYKVSMFATNNCGKIVALKPQIEFRTRYGDKDTEYTGPVIKTIEWIETGEGQGIARGKLINPGNAQWVHCKLEKYSYVGWDEGGNEIAVQSIIELGWFEKEANNNEYPPFDVSLTELRTNAKFSIRFVAENNAGQTGYGEVVPFTTSARLGEKVKPKVRVEIIRVTDTTAAFEGFLDDMGTCSNLKVWMVSGPVQGTPSSRMMRIKWRSKIWERDQSDKFFWSVEGLFPGVQYGVQIYAQEGEIFTNMPLKDGYLPFATYIAPPKFAPEKTEFITDTKALFSAIIDYPSSSGKCLFWIEWGKATDAYGSSKFENKMPIKVCRAGTDNANYELLKGFSWEASSLDPNTDYSWRVVAEPKDQWDCQPTGSEKYYYSEAMRFSTLRKNANSP